MDLSDCESGYLRKNGQEEILRFLVVFCIIVLG